jgi:hypothetical protein
MAAFFKLFTSFLGADEYKKYQKLPCHSIAHLPPKRKHISVIAAFEQPKALCASNSFSLPAWQYVHFFLFKHPCKYAESCYYERTFFKSP